MVWRWKGRGEGWEMKGRDKAREARTGALGMGEAASGWRRTGGNFQFVGWSVLVAKGRFSRRRKALGVKSGRHVLCSLISSKVIVEVGIG
jgi:hypothetical protein